MTHNNMQVRGCNIASQRNHKRHPPTMEQSQGRGSPGGDFRGAASSGGGGASLTSKLDSDSSVANWCGPAALVEELCENWLSSLERTSAPCLLALCLPAPRAGNRPVPGAKRGPAPRPETLYKPPPLGPLRLVDVRRVLCGGKSCEALRSGCVACCAAGASPCAGCG